jgi:hypothetical protein
MVVRDERGDLGYQVVDSAAGPCSRLLEVIVSADTDFGEMLGFADTIFGQTPGS